MIALAGCAPGPRDARVALAPRQAPAAEPAQGGAWQAVLPGTVVSGLLAPEESPHWIEVRRDASLTPRPIEPLLASESWPEPRRPSLERPRFVRVIRSADGFIYYRVERRQELYLRRW